MSVEAAQPLSVEQINALLAKTRDRGGHERFLRKELVATGASYVQLNLFPKYAEANESTIKQGLKNAAAKIEGLEIKVVDAGEDMGWIVVNLTVHTANLTESEDGDED